MNVRLNPLVRCSFDEESFALRVIAKEPVERANTPVEQWPQEVVIYVMKVWSALYELPNSDTSLITAWTCTQRRFPQICRCIAG